MLRAIRMVQVAHRDKMRDDMTILLGLVVSIGLFPFAIGLWRLHGNHALQPVDWRGLAASTLLCALAFSLTFFWQEVGLVVPKALTPGLEPILYHNDHDWRGDAPIAELLQAGGAVATLASGLLFLWIVSRIGRDFPTWRLFAFWMAFQGLFQSLSQWSVGSLIAGNDVGRAFAYLGVGPTQRGVVLILTVLAMFAAGRALARHYPLAGGTQRRATAMGLLGTLSIAIVLIIPFRVPREPVEVVLIPLVVHAIGLGWLVLGLSTTGAASDRREPRPALLIPALALAALLAFFQLVLRPGIAF